MNHHATYAGVQRPKPIGFWGRSAVVVVVMGLVLKAVALSAFLIALPLDGVSEDCHEFCIGYDGAVFFLWVFAEIAIAVPTILSLAILWSHVANGNQRLLRFLIPGLLFNVPVWFILLLAWSGLT